MITKPIKQLYFNPVLYTTGCFIIHDNKFHLCTGIIELILIYFSTNFTCLQWNIYYFIINYVIYPSLLAIISQYLIVCFLQHMLTFLKISKSKAGCLHKNRTNSVIFQVKDIIYFAYQNKHIHTVASMTNP